MLKSVKEFLGEGVQIYPIISLLIFFIFFIGLLLWVFTYKKKDVDRYKNMPLNEKDDNADNNAKKNIEL